MPGRKNTEDLCGSRSPSPLPSWSSAATLAEASSCWPIDFASKLVLFEQFAQENKEEMRSHEAGFHYQTHGVMCIHTRTMFAHSLRDYRRQQYAPTKPTKPPLLQRRYSVDVNVGAQQREENETKAAEVLSLEDIGSSPHPSAHQTPPASLPHLVALLDLDPIATSAQFLSFPDPLRHSALNCSARKPPQDDDCYLTFQDASISNNQFHYITLLGGGEALMQDYCLDMTLKILTSKEDCDASGIAVANTIESQVFYYADGDPSGLEEYAALFGPAKWIFIPINDGTGNTINNSVYGSHWSLLALDRIHKVAHYFDSFYISSQQHLKLASAVFRGAMGVLGEDAARWKNSIEWGSPHQLDHNLCKDDAGGACGPFVYTMILFLVDRIQKFQQRGQEGDCELNLQEGFAGDFGEQWHSGYMRHKMQASIASMRLKVDAYEATKKHDEIALQYVEGIMVLPLPADAEAL